MAKLTYGNPFTHEEHSRESRSNTGVYVSTCDWCGSTPRTLYHYDGYRGWFCNKSCYRSYHF